MEENEWEAIQLPNSSSTTTTQSDEDDGDAVMVATPTKPSISPPSNHEGLLVTPPLSPQHHPFHQPISATSSPPPSPSYTSSLTPSSSGVEETEFPNLPETVSTGAKARLGILSSGVLRIAYGIRSRFGIWSIASVAAILVVALYGRRWQRWRRRGQKENRDQMMLLINQKDEKIKQLLIQIDQMNEILSARKRVPVHRIVVDRPFINKQRLNWKPT